MDSLSHLNVCFSSSALQGRRFAHEQRVPLGFIHLLKRMISTDLNDSLRNISKTQRSLKGAGKTNTHFNTRWPCFETKLLQTITSALETQTQVKRLIRKDKRRRPVSACVGLKITHYITCRKRNIKLRWERCLCGKTFLLTRTFKLWSPALR